MIDLRHGDCLEIMKTIPNKSVDMVLCDLPYGVLNKGNPSARWDSVIPFDKLWGQYNRICKDNTAIVLFGQGVFTAKLIMSNMRMWKYNLVWKKGTSITGFLNAKRMPLRNHEDIIVFYKRQPVYNPQMQYTGRHMIGSRKGHEESGRNSCYGKIKSTKGKASDTMYPRSILTFPPPHGGFYHPTEKPVPLLEYLIKTYTNVGGVVLDNTMGSGSTGVACIRTERDFIGIELDDQYFETARRRCDEEQERIMRNGRQVTMLGDIDIVR